MYFKIEQFENISEVSLTDGVLNVFPRFNVFKDEQFENIPFIELTFNGLKLDKLRKVIFVQNPNINSISLTSVTSNLETSIESKDIQYPNK